jgi:hypothetical protein
MFWDAGKTRTILFDLNKGYTNGLRSEREKLIETITSLMSPSTGSNFKSIKHKRGKVLFNLLACPAYSSNLNMVDVHFSEMSVNLLHTLQKSTLHSHGLKNLKFHRSHLTLKMFV